MRLWEATGYRLPPAGWVSILHRVSGVIMFVLLPFIIWMFDTSLTSEISYGTFTSVFNAGWGGLPGWFYKLVALVLIWAYLHHFFAGLRHLWMDATHAVTLKFGRSSAIATLVVSLVLTVALGAKLFPRLRPGMAIDYGSKRTLSGAHYGLRDWLSQRATAALMAIFTVVLIVQVLLPGELGYDRWAGIFSHQWMKALTFVVIVSILVHVWVGIRDVLMDYVKAVGMRLSLQVFSIVWLVGCAGWAIQVIWRL